MILDAGWPGIWPLSEYQTAAGTAFFAIEVGVPVALIARGARIAIARTRRTPTTYTRGRDAKVWWACGFGGLSMALIGVSIGVFILPFAVIACAVAGWRARAIPEAVVGIPLGVSAALLYVGMFCDVAALLGGSGGMNGASWLILGALLLAIGLWARRATGGVRERPNAGNAATHGPGSSVPEV